MRTVFSIFTFFLLSCGLTAQVPTIVKEVGPGNFNGIPSLPYSAIVGNTLYFIGNDVTHGNELWKTDGTEIGTVLVKDIYTGNQGSQQVFYAVYKDQLYFKAYNPEIREEIWRTDSTEGAKLILGDPCPGTCGGGFNGSSFTIMAEYDEKLYFKLKTPDKGTELWVTDGTEGNTTLLKDINPGDEDANPYSLTVFQNKMYFVANSPQIGSELWVTDGTSSGTLLVKDINTSFFGPSDIDAIITGPNAFYFWARKSNGEGKELWKSDGTADGTVQLKEIGPGTASGQPEYVYLSNSAWLNDKLLFIANDGVVGAELWITDGTEENTQLLVDVNPGSANSDIEFLTTWNDKVYFRAKTASNGHELWVTDGTSTGTQLLKDINPGTGDGLYFFKVHFTLHNDKMYVEANNGVSGRELWITDGTASGTQMLFDINPGASGSIPSHFQVMGNDLYFFAETQTSGRELFKLPLTTSSTQHSIAQLPLRLYPTLSSDGAFYFDYSGEKSETFDIAIFDALGSMSYQVKQTLDTPLRLPSLSSGTYVARITAKDGRYASQKIVIGQ